MDDLAHSENRVTAKYSGLTTAKNNKCLLSMLLPATRTEIGSGQIFFRSMLLSASDFVHLAVFHSGA